VHRSWDPAQHPQWLVFEAEGRLQVRPAQAAIVTHLLSHPGAIAQLNMGEGKTRVILPLLSMCLADGSRIVSGLPGVELQQLSAHCLVRPAGSRAALARAAVCVQLSSPIMCPLF
jgi:hypothetical protein